MPETKDHSRCKAFLPPIVTLNGRLDEPEQLNRVIFNLAVDLPGHRAHRQRHNNAVRRSEYGRDRD